jgi:predicted phosphodiesterase
MAYKYTHFIPQNIAPKGAKKIVVHNSKGEKVTDIPLGGLTPPNAGKLYSFGLVSDVHIAASTGVAWIPHTKFDNALSYFENQGCKFCCVCGDLTQTGLYRRTSESDASTTYLDEGQLAKYKEICDKYSIAVYEMAGNHESYYGMPISDNLTKWGTYTGKNVLHYTVSQGNDLFIFLGHPSASIPMSDEAFDFLSATLSANSDRRCFVFVHPLWNDDSGDVHINGTGLYAKNGSGGGTLLSSWSKGTALKNLLKQYPKAVLFHGHTHIKFEEQEKDKALNYTNKNGFHSVHIPSLGRPRDIVDNKLVYAESESQGYIVDVYDDCIVLNGMDFITNTPVPLGTFKIDTTLQTVEANTFTDSTGTIKTT